MYIQFIHEFIIISPMCNKIFWTENLNALKTGFDHSFDSLGFDTIGSIGFVVNCVVFDVGGKELSLKLELSDSE